MAGGLSSDSEVDSGSHSQPIAAINVTPFVDVALVLLVIFIVTAPTILKDVIGVELPKASSSDTKTPSSLGIAITRQGQILVNGELSSYDALAAEAKRLSQDKPDTQAIISADTEARHGDVVKVIDTIKTAGLSRFAIQIERQP